MGSIRRPEAISALVKISSSIISLPPSVVNIGAYQYKNIYTLTIDTGIVGVGGFDVAVSSSTLYYAYAIVSDGAMALIASSNSSLPSGFTLARQVGSFFVGASNLIYEWTSPQSSFTEIFIEKTAGFTAEFNKSYRINTASNITAVLPAAVASGGVITLLNINSGIVTVDPNASELLIGQSTMTLYQYQAIKIIDYATGKWAIY